jgi:hypothetical protein
LRRTTMILKLNSIALVALLCLLVGAPLGAQSIETPESRLARTAVDALPIGATVNIRTRNGERVAAVLLSVDEAGIRVKPATRVPERSRLIGFDQIERIERHQDRVSVGKYVGIGSSIGAAVLLLLLAGV